MKTTRLPLLLAGFLSLSSLLHAQTITSGVPGFISYQGRVLDSAGAPVGTGTPVNRTVTFRVWDHPSNVLAANLIYSEQQTVTIADGKFSVLVGQGVATTGGLPFSETPYGPGASPVVSIANAFNGSGRYLGVTVDDGTVAVDNEIAPRQQIVSSAFAFRSKFAETLGTNNTTALTVLDSGNIGVGNTSPTGRFTVTAPVTSTTTINPQFLLTDSADPNESLRIGVDSTGSAGNGSGFLQSWKENFGATNLLLNPNGGNVGIGTNAPQGRLHVVDTGLSVYTSNGTSGGFAKDGLTVDSNPGAGFSSMVINSNHSSVADRGILNVKRTGVSQFYVRTDGNVGIGTAAPGYKLQVQGSLWSQSLDTGTANMGPSRILGTGRNTGQGGLYLEWGNQSPGSYGQSYILNNQEAGNPGIFLGEVNNAHSINWSLFTQPSRTDINGHIYAWSFQATSDERTKSVVGRSSSEADLDIVRKLRVTDYHFIDQKRGTGLQKGFIAQEVKTVVPEAVRSTGKNFIPSVYAEAKKLTFDEDSQTLSITMAKAHDLKVGDFVEMTEDGTRHEWKVSGVKDDKTFAVGPVKEVPAKLFVYGKQVPDLLAVDYDRLFVSGIGAIQELVKQVDAVKLENTDLKSKLAASEKRLAEMSATDQAFEAKLTALEKRISTGKADLKTVSTQ